MRKIRKIFISALIAVLLVSLIISAVFLSLSHRTEKVYAEESFFVVNDVDNDIYNDSLKRFDFNKLNDLYAALTGDSTFTAFANKVNSTPGKTLTSDDFRNNNGGKNVAVWFGGKKWDAVHITTVRDTYTEGGAPSNAGDIILTLWQSVDDISIQGAFSVYNSNSGNYPSQMYSTSNARVYLLNVGGYRSTGTSTLEEIQQSAESTYARFTMKAVDNSLVEYLVQPKDVAYQETEVSPAIWKGGVTYYMNDAYNASVDNYTNYGSDHEESKYSAWKNDYLWLPSIAEIGKDDTYYSGYSSPNDAGLWETDNELRKSNNSWVRSGNHYFSNDLSNYFTDSGICHYSPSSYSYYVRPALHLNLSVANKHAGLTVPQDITVKYSNEENGIESLAKKGLAAWYNEEIYSSGITITYADADTKSPVQASDTKKAGKYTVTFTITNDNMLWYDSQDDLDKTREITLTVQPETINIDYDENFKANNNYVYHTDEKTHKLRIPAGADGSDYNETYIKLGAATDSDKQSVKILYYVSTHKESEHDKFIEDDLPRLQALLESLPDNSAGLNGGDATTGWAKYTEDNTTLNVNEPKGYCVFYKITADNHETLYGYFSVHIATEVLKITTTGSLGTPTYGDEVEYLTGADKLKTYIETQNIITQILDNNNENRLDKLNKDLFEFYIYQKDTAGDIEKPLGSRLDAGDYYLGVKYIEPDSESFIHFVWNSTENDENGQPKDGEHPKLTIKPKEVAIEWATGVADDVAEKAKVSDSASGEYVDKLSWAFDDTEKTPTAKFTDVDGSDQTLTLSYSGDRKSAGTFTATAQTVKNYTFTKDSQDFKILQAKNGWKTEFKCYNFSVGDTPKETGGEPLFGKAEKFYFTGDNFGTQFNDANWPAGEYRVKFTVGATPDYDGLDSSNEPDQRKYTFTVSECVHNFQGQPYQHNDSQHWQICKNCGAPGNYKDHTPQNGGELVQGETQHWLVCEVCKVEYSKANHVYKAGDIIKEAKCNEKGEQEYKCDCGAIDPEKHELPMIDHTYEHDGDGKKWYHTEGSTEHKHWHECTVCGERTDEANCTQTEIPEKEPTCLLPGYEAGVGCSVCKKIILEPKERKPYGHNYDKSNVNEIDAPTCEEAGRGTVFCTRCEKDVDVDIPATGHSYGEWHVKTAATCIAGGVNEHECSNCHATETQATAPDLTAHKRTADKVYQAATATRDGWDEHYECEDCHEFLNANGTLMSESAKENLRIPALGTPSVNGGSSSSDWLKDNWWWLVIAVAVILLFILLIFIITSIRNRRREQERLERERERDRQFETFMKMQMMSSYNMGGFAGGGQPDGAAALDGAQYALPPVPQEMMNAAVSAAVNTALHIIEEHEHGANPNEQGVPPYYGQTAQGGAYGYGQPNGQYGQPFGQYGQPNGQYGQPNAQPEPAQPSTDQPAQGAQYGQSGAQYGQQNGQPTAQQYSQPTAQPFITPESPQPQQQAAQAQPQPSQPSQPSQPPQPEFKDNDGFYDSYKKPKYDDDDDEDD